MLCFQPCRAHQTTLQAKKKHEKQPCMQFSPLSLTLKQLCAYCKFSPKYYSIEEGTGHKEGKLKNHDTNTVAACIGWNNVKQ